jgi:hypothetical protein
MKQAEEVINELIKLGKEPFLVGGTALWAYRDNSLPSGNSHSFGIGVKGFEGQSELYRRLEELGYKTKRIIGSVVQADKELQFMVFFLRKEGDEWYSYRHHVGRYLSVPDKFMKLQEINLLGLKVKVPSPVEDYLFWVYGEKWRDKTQINKSFPPVGIFKT